MFARGLIIAAFVFLLDRLSKWWFIDVFELPKKGVVEILPIFNVVMYWNRGVSFSLFSAETETGRWILVGMTCLIVVVLLFWLRSVQARLTMVAIGLVIGGAIGNIYDRVMYGAVADFFQFHLGDWSFAVFNVADCFISLGATVLVWEAFFGSSAEKKKQLPQ
ncbi:signal peptidase II [Emcibacter nanhaiensis]|uniref:Lipoprotein signal peptidase n=1 Tax=Emcibacter nanhaiensis TaxID=1505037 RepID=A0A501PQ34_9PROT|nr:signal peptidase II [Emcibacter nanhaiensis]TPD61896.1 signal peptidase II [Emcibacter nanhaiensis]